MKTPVLSVSPPNLTLTEFGPKLVQFPTCRQLSRTELARSITLVRRIIAADHARNQVSEGDPLGRPRLVITSRTQMLEHSPWWGWALVAYICRMHFQESIRKYIDAPKEWMVPLVFALGMVVALFLTVITWTNSFRWQP